MTSNTTRHLGRRRGGVLPVSDGLSGAGSAPSRAAEISGVGSTGDSPGLGSSTQPRVARRDARTNHGPRCHYVAELAALRSAGTGATAPMSWFNLNAEQATADLVELTRWVYSVLLHYSVVSQQLTDCWRRHPSAVEGLLALRAAWYTAYRRPGARPETAVDWHIRLLPGVADLLREELRACSESNHAPGGEIERYRRSRPRVLPDEEHVRGYAVWWAATRGVGPDPEVS